jgi:hypothetical protein
MQGGLAVSPNKTEIAVGLRPPPILAGDSRLTKNGQFRSESPTSRNATGRARIGGFDELRFEDLAHR